MNFSTWQKMDPHLLVGLVNTELRNHSESLDDFSKTHNIDLDQLNEKLAAAGYEFVESQRQYR